MTKLLLSDRPVVGPLHLLRLNENGLTFALGFAFQQVPGLLRLVLERNGITWNGRGHAEIRLQDRSDEGITDVEVLLRNAHVTIEAKINGWPGKDQLSRYAGKMTASGRGQRLVVALGVPPPPMSLIGLRRFAGNVRVTQMRWIEMLGLVRAECARAPDTKLPILSELASLIEELIGMQHYDREVLVRDVNVDNRSYGIYFDGNIYSCQARENAEPLFFAPCFTGSDRKLEDGIHYFSRVYYRGLIAKKDRGALLETLERAAEVIHEKVEVLKRRKTTKKAIEYLTSLSPKWKKGLRDMPAGKPGVGRAIFFLGDPIRLPQPLHKDGKMVPIGFSMTIEHLMTSEAARFRC